MSKQQWITDEHLRRIVGLAESGAGEQTKLSEAQVREIGEALGLGKEALEESIGHERYQAMGESDSPLAGPGVPLILGRSPGFSRPILIRSLFIAACILPFIGGLRFILGVLPLSESLMFLMFMTSSIVYPAVQAFRMAYTRSFAVGFGNRVVVGKRLPTGRVLTWDRPLAQVRLEVAPTSKVSDTSDFLAMYELVFRDQAGSRFQAFTGLVKDDLEAIAESFVLRREKLLASTVQPPTRAV